MAADDNGRLFPIDPYEEQQFETDAKNLKMPFPKDAGTQARNFGGWTLDKLSLFDLYLKPFRRVAGSGTYIDGFAGSGTVTVNGEDRPGSARVALDSGAFKHFHLYEIDRSLVAELEAMRSTYRPLRQGRTFIGAGDTNSLLVNDLNAGVIDRDKACFAFLDPDSTQLAWTTVEALAKYKTYEPGVDPKHPKACKVELWILFNTHQALMRLVPKQLPDNFEQSGFAVALDFVMGGRDAWWDLLATGFTYGTLLERYVNRLKNLGYALVRTCVIRNPADGSPQYYMVHASDHPTAHSFMFWAQKTHRIDTGLTPPMFTESQIE